MITKKNITITAFTGLMLIVTNSAFAAEPTEAQMKEAIIQSMQNEGGAKRSGNDSVRIDNALSGAQVKINHFKKIGCEKAASRPGYNCDYEISAGINFHSNEGTHAGNAHAGGINALFGAMLGGSGSRISTGTKRFVYSNSQWRVLHN